MDKDVFFPGVETMSLSDLLKRDEPILLDGAMGTQLAAAGLPMGGQVNMSNPDGVLEVHKKYIQCGCHLLITNTLTMNRIYIESHKIDVDVREVNVTGAKLAKTAASGDQYVLGDISSTGKIFEPSGDLKESEAYETFKEQASILVEGGVDGFIIETMFDLAEAICALRACKEVSDLPVIASIAFSSTKNGGRTMMGNSAEECAKQLTDFDASAVGANCGDLDPVGVAEIVAVMKKNTSLPVVAQPNAGTPELVGDETIFKMGPDEFAKGVLKCLGQGATLVGGCCGTSPAHISAVAEALK